MKSLLCLLLLAGLCITMPATGAATLTYTGDLAMYPENVRLCANALNDLGRPLAGESLLFTALDLWNITRTSPLSFARTDSLGGACLKANLPPGVYEAQAFGADGGPLAGIASQPVAITVSAHNQNGFGVSGVFSLRERGQTQSRNATFGLYYPIATGPLPPVGGPLIYYVYLPEGRTEQFLFLDPDSPSGAVRIRIRDFRQAYGRIIFPNYQVSELRLTGNCEFTVGSSAPTTRQCEIVFTLTGMTTGMNLDVLDYARRSIYHVAGVPTTFYPG